MIWNWSKAAKSSPQSTPSPNPYLYSSRLIPQKEKMYREFTLAIATLILSAWVAPLAAQLDACRPAAGLRMESFNVDPEFEDYVKRFAERGGHLDTQVLLIPAVVHVVFDDAVDSLDAARVESQIDALNRDFRRLNADSVKTRPEFQPAAADLHVEFCLAGLDPAAQATNGIRWHRVPGLKMDSVQAVLARTQWPPERYLNIWVLPVISGGNSSFPWSKDLVDGFMVATSRFGTTGDLDEGFTEGRVAVHEAGHYLGLFHTFEGGFQYLGQCDVPCEDTGDRVCDTPLDWILHWSTEQCEEGERFCDDGSSFFVQSENYMAYAYDTCTNLFTAGQRIRVRATLDSLRAQLVSPENLILTGCRRSTAAPGISPAPARLTLFPQPAYRQLNVDFGVVLERPVSLRLLTAAGQLVFSTTTTAATASIALDLPGLPPGLYVLHAYSGARHWVEKVAIAR
jgi:hypothetical protein